MTTRPRIVAQFFALLFASPVAAQATRQASVAWDGTQANSYSERASISADGRYVAFESQATNLVPGDTNGESDIFVRDLVAGTTEIVSVDSSGVIGNDDSRYPSISADGRYVVFQSNATNLIPIDAYFHYDVYLHDRVTSTTEKVNLTPSGAQTVSGRSSEPSISADGRYVAFHSSASDLVAGDTNGEDDVFVRERVLGTTEMISVSAGGAHGNNHSFAAEISTDGRFVGFMSFASNLVPGDTAGQRDIFLRDRQLGTIEIVNVDSDENQANGTPTSFAISADGRFVAFSHNAGNLVPGDTNFRSDAFVRDRTAGTTERVSLNSGEGETEDNSYASSISADGRFVAMHSFGTHLVPGDTNGTWDVFVRDRQSGTTERVSLGADGAQGNGYSDVAAISADGRWVAFRSFASNLAPGDTNSTTDILVRDREATAFSSLCDPGVGVLACPCSNPPGGPTRGCNNSSATGGAVLSASGTAQLSADTLVFTTSGEKPTALSIVLQGTVFLSSGVVYGQGIRCVGGSLKRLYAKSAVGGSITAPDFGAGDQSVSARSAAKGDVIQPGAPRWYMVYYRDNTVLGGCPSSSTFNTTQTGMVSWSP